MSIFVVLSHIVCKDTYYLSVKKNDDGNLENIRGSITFTP